MSDWLAGMQKKFYRRKCFLMWEWESSVRQKKHTSLGVYPEPLSSLLCINFFEWILSLHSHRHIHIDFGRAIKDLIVPRSILSAD